MSLSAKKIEKNWNLFKQIIDTYITDRKESVNRMVEDLSDTIAMSPASHKSWHHSAFPGGYLDHVNRVVRISLEQKEMWQKLGGVVDFTEEELVFSALFHDLGKIGDGDKECYVKQTDKWRREKLDEEYTFNPELDFMLVPDRSLFILQKYGIQVSKKEYLAIKLHDGMFSDTNKPYFLSHYKESLLRTNIVYILHVADYLASKIEFSQEHQK